MLDGGVASVSQSTRPSQRSRFSAYQRIVRRTPSSHETFGSQPVSRVQLLVADAQRHHVGDAGPQALLRRDDRRGRRRPEAVLDADPEDQVGPVRHRDVLALAVDVDVAGTPLAATVRWPRTPSVQKQKSRSGSSAPSSISGRVERLRDDRAGHVARVLARPVVVEHPRDDARDAERVVVVHRQEVGGDLRGRVDRLRVDRRALVQDQAARVVEVVVVRDGLAHVAVLLRGAGGVELLELEAPVDDRLEQVERADRVRHHRLVGPVPRLADVRLCAEVEDVRLVGRVA